VCRNGVAHDTGIEDSALLPNYLPVLATVYAIVNVPAWPRDPTGPAVKRPTDHLADPSLAAHLPGVNRAALAALGAAALGTLIETFAVAELIRQPRRLPIQASGSAIVPSPGSLQRLSGRRAA
jgi:predicted AAA+ superfamily ATPase